MREVVAQPGYGDGKDQRIWIAWVGFIFAQIERILKPGGYFFSFIDWRMLPALSDSIQLADLAWRGIIVWDKGRSARPFPNGFKQQCDKPDLSRMLKSVAQLWLYIRVRRNGTQYSTAPRLAQKPLEVLKHCLEVLPRGSVVLDCFCGSGSTGVACAQLDLDFIGASRQETDEPG
ncbi:site-specific DNA-methyltransferase [Helicobacter vulpis]|uniref:site-specific DNA-methyltransferase n=1 Tax=Helicobacter vulpis TaxID=2316076 RepID=UPI000EADC3FA|nr:site-specific DNA-methyltransferase [Helicobacter vulpis]